MSPQPDACQSFDLSPFCANDQLYLSNLSSSPGSVCELPGYDDLLTSIKLTGNTKSSSMSLLVVGLSPFTASYHDLDEYTSQIASLGAAAKLAQCLRQHKKLETKNIPPAQTDAYRLATLQFAILTNASAKALSSLCENLLTTLDQPLYVGRLKLKTQPAIGVARGEGYYQPESMLRAAQSALFTCQQR